MFENRDATAIIAGFCDGWAESVTSRTEPVCFVHCLSIMSHEFKRTYFHIVYRVCHKNSKRHICTLSIEYVTRIQKNISAHSLSICRKTSTGHICTKSLSLEYVTSIQRDIFAHCLSSMSQEFKKDIFAHSLSSMSQEFKKDVFALYLTNLSQEFKRT